MYNLPINPEAPAGNAGKAPEAASGGGEEAWREEADRTVRRERRRLVLLAALVGTLVLAAPYTPLNAWLENIQGWKALVRAHAWRGGLAFMLVSAAAVMMGLPRLPLAATAGLIFGFNRGIFWVVPGAALGAYGTFLLARAGLGAGVARRATRWPWLRPLLENPSVAQVFWLRQFMIPGVVTNVLLGMTPVRHTVFWAGTLVGYLPLSIAFCLVGSGLGKADLAHTLAQLLAALGTVNVIGWLIWRRARRSETHHP